jgi:hypothetical protein
MSFRVIQVVFEVVPYNNESILAALIEFNKPVDAATIVKGVNLRLLREDDENSGFWNDAYPSTDLIVRVVQGHERYVAIGSLNPLNYGNYKVHIRGTIMSTATKSSGAEYLDCNGDGTPEGGQLPAYNSHIFTWGTMQEDLEGIIENLREQIEIMN